jgi:hypothetical protein
MNYGNSVCGTDAEYDAYLNEDREPETELPICKRCLYSVEEEEFNYELDSCKECIDMEIEENEALKKSQR